MYVKMAKSDLGKVQKLQNMNNDRTLFELI